MPRTATAVQLRSHAILECERVGVEGVRGMLAGMQPADRRSKLPTTMGEPGARVLYWEAAAWLQQQDAAAQADAEEANAATEGKADWRYAETAGRDTRWFKATTVLTCIGIVVTILAALGAAWWAGT